MKTLIITGKLAEDSVREQVSDFIDVDVLALPVSVASFITPSYAVNELQKRDLSNYDMLIVPGTMSGDLRVIEDALGVATFRGPLHSADLSLAHGQLCDVSR